MHLDQVYALGRDLMDANGLQGWSLGWDRARRRAGQCNHTNRCITLSRYLMQLYDLPRVRDTILHEVAMPWLVQATVTMKFGVAKPENWAAQRSGW